MGDSQKCPCIKERGEGWIKNGRGLFVETKSPETNSAQDFIIDDRDILFKVSR